MEQSDARLIIIRKTINRANQLVDYFEDFEYSINFEE